MQSRALEMLVGLFVSLGVAAVFVLTFRVASLDTVGGADQTYRVSASFENIGGLKVGSPITLAGVRVGRVTGIQVDQELFEAVVTMAISREFNRIPQDSDAQILTAGLLGEQYIGLNAGGSDQFLAEGGELKLTQSALVLEKLIGTVIERMSGGPAPGGADKGGTPPADALSE